MEYNIVVAPDLEVLATEVAGFIPMGWKLKGGILEHMDGYAQQLVRRPGAVARVQHKSVTKNKRTRWIE